MEENTTDLAINEVSETESEVEVEFEPERTGFARAPINLTEEEKEHFPRNLLTTATSSERMMFGFKIAFESFPFMFSTGIYKVFLLDWIRTFIIGAIAMLLFLITSGVGNNINSADTTGKVLMAVAFFLSIAWLFASACYIASEIVRMDAFRRIQVAVKQSVCLGLDSNWVCCPPCSGKCGLFTLKWFLVDCLEVPVIVIISIILSALPGSSTILSALYHSLFAFRAIFIQKEGACSYFKVYPFWLKHWDLCIGIAFAFFVFGMIPFVSIIILPFTSVVGVRLYYIIEHLETGGDNEERVNEGVVGEIAEMNEMQPSVDEFGTPQVQEIESQEKNTEDLKNELFGNVGDLGPESDDDNM